MQFAPINVALATHPKIVGLNDSEFRMQVTGILYGNAHLTDGLISRAAARTFPGYKAATTQRLEERGLWLPHDDGWVLHDFLDWNMSASEVEQAKVKRSRAGRAGAASRWGHDMR